MRGEAVYTIREKPAHVVVSSLRVQIEEPEQSKQESIENARQRKGGILFVEDCGRLARPHSTGAHVHTENTGPGKREFEECPVLRESEAAYEGADHNALIHRRDPGSFESGPALLPVEVAWPDDGPVGPCDCIGAEPIKLRQKYIHARMVAFPRGPLQVMQPPPGHEERVVLRSEEPILFQRHAMLVELDVLEKEMVAIDVVSQRVRLVSAWDNRERIVNPKADGLLSDAPDGAARGLDEARLLLLIREGLIVDGEDRIAEIWCVARRGRRRRSSSEDPEYFLHQIRSIAGAKQSSCRRARADVARHHWDSHR